MSDEKVTLEFSRDEFLALMAAMAVGAAMIDCAHPDVVVSMVKMGEVYHERLGKEAWNELSIRMKDAGMNLSNVAFQSFSHDDAPTQPVTDRSSLN